MASSNQLIRFEDEHLLVVHKPAGLNTHAPSPFAGEGLYEWLKNREPRWGSLAIIHRLDKETSGVMVFGKTPLANRSLTSQFTAHTIKKHYRLVTDRPVKFKQLTVTSSLMRIGEKYASRSLAAAGERAETHFQVVDSASGRTTLIAEPVTGRTHQIRAQAAAEGFPILGDILYGGTAASRVFLHAAELQLAHPETSAILKFTAPENFDQPKYIARDSLIDSASTNAQRVIHGAADGHPGWYVERWQDFLLSQSDSPITEEQTEMLRELMRSSSARGSYHKILNRKVRQSNVAQASPQFLLGDRVGENFSIRENGVVYEASFHEGYSVGLFLDQRENRRRLLTNHIAPGFPVFAKGVAKPEVLNAFAYTCGFSVCAAKFGARATSVDLSKKYLEWGRRNFTLNGLDPAQHDFIFGDVFDWLRRLAKKGRAYDLILLDPPTFSQSKETGVFQAEKDYGRLADLALTLLKPEGVLFASTNAARLEPENFLDTLRASIQAAGRKILHQHYVPQPPDFPVSREEPAYLKTVWLRVS
jgi:23S rRNA (cytosine1962-C5)-methyltransferase